MMFLYQLRSPRQVHAGSGCLSALINMIKEYDASRVAVITDAGIRQSGLLNRLEEVLRQASSVQWKVYDEIPTEPAYASVQTVVDQVTADGCDMVVGFGGGSVMDTAKLCSILCGSSIRVKDLLKAPLFTAKALCSVMIPTTCGTGSEATCNAIVGVPEEEIKVGIVTPSMIPDGVLLDGELLRGLPPKLLASTGVDALAHAVECYTSKAATPLSDTFAHASAKLIFRNIRRAYGDRDDIESKNAMLLGAFYGGAAIAGSGTTAVHALSYPLGGKYHIPHGVSNAILFAPVMRVNREVCLERLAALYDGVYPENPAGLCTADDKSCFIIDEIGNIVRELDIPDKLTAFGVPPADLESLALSGSGVTRLLNNNRRVLTLDDIREIYRSVL